MITGLVQPTAFNPAERGEFIVEVGTESVDQFRKQRPLPDVAGLSQGQYPLHPAVALFTGCPLGTPAPRDRKAQHPLGMIVGRSNSLFDQEQPQGVHLPAQPASKAVGVIMTILVESDQANESGVKCPPLTNRGWRPAAGGVTQALQFSMGPLTEARDLRILAFRKGLGFSNQVG